MEFFYDACIDLSLEEYLVDASKHPGYYHLCYTPEQLKKQNSKRPGVKIRNWPPLPGETRHGIYHNYDTANVLRYQIKRSLRDSRTGDTTTK